MTMLLIATASWPITSWDRTTRRLENHRSLFVGYVPDLHQGLFEHSRNEPRDKEGDEDFNQVDTDLPQDGGGNI